MRDFKFYNPTKIYFGKESLKNLSRELLNYGENVLLAYGGGSIKHIGLYDKLIEILTACNKKVVEFPNIMSNPTADKVREGIQLVRKHNVDLILAVGGGSTIDCAKVVAVGAKMEGDFWELMFNKRVRPTGAVPLAAILTVVGTGSEMDSGAVITNTTTSIKAAVSNVHMYPKFSILNPEFTFSVPKLQTVYGGVDTMSHIMELYFSKPDYPNVSDDLCEALLKSMVVNLRAVLVDPLDYVARGNLMWASTMAINDVLACGKRTDWESHQIEHQLSAYYDIPHGAGLAIVGPAYYRAIYPDGLSKFVQFAENVWGISPEGKTDEQVALAGIDALEAFYQEIGAPTRLSQVGIDGSWLDKISDSCNLLKGGYRTLTHGDVKAILTSCL